MGLLWGASVLKPSGWASQFWGVMLWMPLLAGELSLFKVFLLPGDFPGRELASPGIDGTAPSYPPGDWASSSAHAERLQDQAFPHLSRK